jgi:uncharacterized phiE125 gp8 family phage protein
MSLKLISRTLDGSMNYEIVEPITLEEACAHLRLNIGDDDVTVEALIVAARQYFDGYEGILGRCLISQVWEQSFDAFPFGNEEIQSIKYIDADGEEQTLNSNQYLLIDDRIYLEYGEDYPKTRRQKNAVKVTFVAGYGDTPKSIPNPIRQAMLMLIAHWYDNRTNVAFASTTLIPFTVDALIAPFRKIGI